MRKITCEPAVSNFSAARIKTEICEKRKLGGGGSVLPVPQDQGRWMVLDSSH